MTERRSEHERIEHDEAYKRAAEHADMEGRTWGVIFEAHQVDKLTLVRLALQEEIRKQQQKEGGF